MKFKVYNQTNSRNSVQGKSTLRINERTGLFTFSKAAGEIMEVQDRGRITILQNEESPEDFYICKDPDGDSFELRGKDKSFSFNSSSLATLILDGGKVIKRAVKLSRNASFSIGKSIEIDGLMVHLILLSKPFEVK